MSDRICTIVGNGDFYGLGLRIGLYLTFISSWLAKYKLEETFTELQHATLAFVLANIAALWRAGTQRSLTGGEVMVIMYLFIAQFGTAASLAKGKWMGGLDLPSTLLFFLSIANKPFWIWFWFKGLDVLPKTPCGEEYAFFFAKVSLFGGFRTFMKIVWVVIALKTLANLCIFLFFILSSHQPAEESGEVSKFENAMKYRAPISLFMSILAVELTIKWNNITGVHSLNSTDQLIPFLVGVAQLLFVTCGTKKRHDLPRSLLHECPKKKLTYDTENVLPLGISSGDAEIGLSAELDQQVTFKNAEASAGSGTRTNVGALTEDEVSKFKYIFSWFDDDDDGDITTERLRTLVKFMNKDPSDLVLPELDVNGGNHNVNISDAEVKELFDIFDRNHDGFITREEWDLTWKSSGETEAFPEVDDTVNKLDANGDGVMDFFVFLAWIRKTMVRDASGPSPAALASVLRLTLKAGGLKNLNHPGILDALNGPRDFDDSGFQDAVMDFAVAEVTVGMIKFSDFLWVEGKLKKEDELYREAFELIAKNNDVITSKELGTTLRSLHEQRTESELQDMIHEIDTEGTGVINLPDFCRMCRREEYYRINPEEGPAENDLREAFRKFDRDGDGFISPAELRHVFASLDEQVTDEEAVDMIREGDQDGDGRLNYDEFRNIMSRC